jgi:hypothetical protein
MLRAHVDNSFYLIQWTSKNGTFEYWNNLISVRIDCRFPNDINHSIFGLNGHSLNRTVNQSMSRKLTIRLWDNFVPFENWTLTEIGRKLDAYWFTSNLFEIKVVKMDMVINTSRDQYYNYKLHFSHGLIIWRRKYDKSSMSELGFCISEPFKSVLLCKNLSHSFNAFIQI